VVDPVGDPVGDPVVDPVVDPVSGRVGLGSPLDAAPPHPLEADTAIAATRGAAALAHQLNSTTSSSDARDLRVRGRFDDGKRTARPLGGGLQRPARRSMQPERR
jgi:hypothetical protein